MSTPNRFQTHWDQAQEFIRKEWPLFSETTIKDIDGDYDRFLGHLKEIYNDFPLNEALARSKLQGFFDQLEDV